MNGWLFVPITMQYVVAGIMSLIIGFFVLHNERGSRATKFFAFFAFSLSLWQLLIFLHRNAPNVFLSKIFFLSGSSFSLLSLLFLFLSISSYQTIDFRYIIVAILNLASLIFMLFAPLKIFWTEYGWSYTFEHELLSFILVSLTAFYILLNSFLIMKIVKSRPPILKKKYKYILSGFTITFIIGIAYNAFPLSFIPNAPPIGGFSAGIGILMISWGILLKEKYLEPQIVKHDFSDELSFFLQRVLNSIEEDILGQRYLKFESFLKEIGLSELVDYTEGSQITILKEPEKHHLVKMLDKTLEYMGRGELADNLLPSLISFWNKIYPVIETDTLVLIKSHEKFFKTKRLIQEIADGKLRTVFLPEGFSEKDLDGFSKYLDFVHKDLFGNPVLVEIDPSESYEEIIKDYIFEVLANCEVLTIFTRKSSRILKYLPTNKQVHVFYLSPGSSKKINLSEHEAELPLYNLTYILGEASTAAENMHSLLIDNLTDLVYSIGFEKTYRFTRSVIEIASSYKVPALFLIAKFHSDEVKAAFENLFPIIVEIKRNIVKRKKP